MSERDLDARLDAVERALTDDETDLSDIRESAEAAGDVADFESRLADLESRVDELEAGLQAVRGYAGNVRAVNREVERRASAALAKAETLETAVEDDGSIDRSTRTGERAERRRAEPRSAGEGQPDRPSEDGSDGPDERPPREPSGHRRGSGGGQHSEVGGEQRAGAESEQRTGVSTGQPTGAGVGHEKRAGAGHQQRSGADGGAGTDDSGTNGESQTEQFIERVRDAL